MKLLPENRPQTWQLLTKRPQNYTRLFLEGFFQRNPHVWIGTTVGVNKSLWRIDYLKMAGAHVKFLSVQPLLEALPTLGEHLDGIDQVIVGCESGPGARPMQTEWAESIRYQCESAGAKFYMKQMMHGRELLHQIERFPPALQLREFPEVRA